MAVMLVIPSLFVLFMIQRQVAPEKLVGGFKRVQVVQLRIEAQPRWAVRRQNGQF
jgi:hypothetical protein